MQKVKELLQKIKEIKDTPVFLEIASDGSFGLLCGFSIGNYVKTWEGGDIEQELEKYLESCKE